MNLMNKVLLLILGLFSLLCCKAQEVNNKYVVNKIDSTSLSYYYLINISPIESLNNSINLLSSKVDSLPEGELIDVGNSYSFNLVRMYDIIEKRGSKDSVYYSPALMKTIVINGIHLFSEDYEVTPFSTNNLIGLRYIKP